ncbi:MAG TPA: type IV pilus twitching motility protein PilT, partial [Actinomycetota bacterium]|nr:type IV pilus twitching motility protein PilT [Actinomycetota bacterium]
GLLSGVDDPAPAMPDSFAAFGGQQAPAGVQAPPAPAWAEPPPIEEPAQAAEPAPEPEAEPAPEPKPRVEAKAPPAQERGYEDGRGSMHALLAEVVAQNASDLHLIAGAKPLLRIHGDLKEVEGWQKVMPNDLQHMIYSILPDVQRARLEEEMELDCAYSVPRSARFRVNIYWQRGSIAGAFRIIPYDILSIEQLGLPNVVRDLARHQRGLVVVTGPTGAGKSTTLAAMVDIVNHERRAHILTVEDPIEFLHKHGRSAVSQREVGPDTHGFAQALKHALRQDPDVILVGEMRDLETIQTAITAAETGHLVLGSLHTQDAPQSIDRIIDVFPPSSQQQIRIQLANTLQGVVAQQLLPISNGNGRVVASEVLVVTAAVRNLIREGKTHQIYSAMQAGRKFGMVTMDASLASLVAEGRITPATALQHAFNPDELARLMGVAPPTQTFQ